MLYISYCNLESSSPDFIQAILYIESPVPSKYLRTELSQRSAKSHRLRATVALDATVAQSIVLPMKSDRDMDQREYLRQQFVYMDDIHGVVVTAREFL